VLFGYDVIAGSQLQIPTLSQNGIMTAEWSTGPAVAGYDTAGVPPNVALNMGGGKPHVKVL